MKKITAVMAVALSVCLFGCASPSIQTKSDRLQVISTIFPSYDFARQVCGDAADVTMLLPPGAESHTYEPTAQDIIRIQDCDLFIYTGGESDTWVDDILSSMDKPVKTVRMMDCVDAVEEEITEGMQAEANEAGEPEEPEYDEHVWTSPKNAVLIVQGIRDALCEVSPANADPFKNNADRYVSELDQLDADFTSFFAGVKNKTMLFGDRFPLRYFADAYGLKYYAAFPGCSTDTEPSAATVAFLTDKAKEENLSTIFYIEFSNHLIADSIAEAAGARTALFHACHNVSKEDMEAGATYLSLMRQNLETLKGAMK